MRRCGLRNSELAEVRWEWFEKREDTVWLALTERSHWSPKGSSGDVPVAAKLSDMLVERLGPPAPGPEARPDPIGRSFTDRGSL